MDEYNFLADLLNTFRLSNGWIKALAITGVFATPVSMLALLILPLKKK